MSLEFAPGWNKEDPYYAKKYGSYQVFLDLISETDVKSAITRATINRGMFDANIMAILLTALDPAGNRVVVEQGAHQAEGPKDWSKANRLEGFTLHFTLRHYHAKGQRAYHAYLAQTSGGRWCITTITYFAGGLKTVQTQQREFMEAMQQQYIRAHGGFNNDD